MPLSFMQLAKHPYFTGSKLAIRGMMITALILSVVGCSGILLGSECTKIFDHKRKMKRKIMFGCGFAFLFSGERDG